MEGSLHEIPIVGLVKAWGLTSEVTWSLGIFHDNLVALEPNWSSAVLQSAALVNNKYCTTICTQKHATY